MEKIKIAFFLLLLIHLQYNEGRTRGQGHDLEEAQLQINYKAILGQTFDVQRCMCVKKSQLCKIFSRTKLFEFELYL